MSTGPDAGEAIAVTDRERDTIIAALRLWQLWQESIFTVPSYERGAALEAIADEHGPGLTNDEIDQLIEGKINV